MLLWLVVNTSVGPLVVQLELHLEAFYERRALAGLLADCFAGVYEVPFLRSAWRRLLHTLSELFAATASKRPLRIEWAIDAFREALQEPEWAGLAQKRLIKETIASAEEKLLVARNEDRQLRDNEDRWKLHIGSIEGVCGLHTPAPPASLHTNAVLDSIEVHAIHSRGWTPFGQGIALGELAIERKLKLQERLRKPEVQSTLAQKCT
jgi:hypothetical protein